MCGICGVFNYAGTNSTVSERMLERMSGEMVHRGPDDDGIFLSDDRKLGLGFRRLSIIDIARGHQPMANEDETVWIVFNGEIYNHLELRQSLEAKGHIYKTLTDTETIVHLYEEKGVDCLKDLRGMFAFAIWDSRKERLFLARDRVGVKPLYFTIKDGTFIFASEIKAILAHPGIDRDIDPVSLIHYLSFLATPAPRTLFQGISKIEPGSFMIIDQRGNIRQEQYWDVLSDSEATTRRPDSDYIEELKDLLSESIRLRTMSEVPVGVFLSGGLDSATIVALMDQCIEGPVSTFTVGFKDYEDQNELRYARQIAKEFNTSHHEVILDHKDLLDCLPQLIYHQDEPVAEPVCLPLYYLAKLAKDSGVPVIQVGEGSDEIFIGYEYYKKMRNISRGWNYFAGLPGPMKQAVYSITSNLFDRMGPKWQRRKEYFRTAAFGQEFFWGSGGAGGPVFHETEKESLLTADFNESIGQTTTADVINRAFRNIDNNTPELDVLQKFTYLDMKIRLGELLLMRVDKMTMAHSVEARVPYLDHKLVEFAMRLPADLKIRGNQLKYILKQATQGVVPDNIIRRKKQGFMVPVERWFKGELSEYVTATLLDSGLRTRGFLNTDYVQEMLGQHRSGRMDHSTKLWSLFNLGLWYRYWIEGKDLQ